MTAPQTKANQTQVNNTAQRHQQTSEGIGTIVTQTASQVEQNIDPSTSQLAKAANDAWNELKDYMTRKIQPDLQKMGEDIRTVASDQLQLDADSGRGIPTPSGGGGGVGGYLNG